MVENVKKRNWGFKVKEDLLRIFQKHVKTWKEEDEEMGVILVKRFHKWTKIEQHQILKGYI